MEAQSCPPHLARTRLNAGAAQETRMLGNFGRPFLRLRLQAEWGFRCLTTINELPSHVSRTTGMGVSTGDRACCQATPAPPCLIVMRSSSNRTTFHVANKEKCPPFSTRPRPDALKASESQKQINSVQGKRANGRYAIEPRVQDKRKKPRGKIRLNPGWSTDWRISWFLDRDLVVYY